jgi:hypothetical protein
MLLYMLGRLFVSVAYGPAIVASLIVCSLGNPAFVIQMDALIFNQIIYVCILVTIRGSRIRVAEASSMSFRGRGGGGGFRGGDRGRGGGRGGFRGRGGGGRGGYDQGPPERVVPLGTFMHACQEDLVVKSSIQDVPYFNAPIYLENIQQVRIILVSHSRHSLSGR